MAIIVIIVVLALRGSNGDRSPLAPYLLFLLGVSFVGIVMAVASAGVVTHAAADLIGPSPISATDYAVSPNPSGPPVSPNSVAATLGPTGSYIQQNDSASLASDRRDRRNHDITAAVTGAAFAASGTIGFLLAWRRARRLLREASPPSQFGRVPLGYAYMVSGAAALAMLILGPLSVSNAFRSIAPGVAGTSGHADGVRRLALTLVLLVLSGGVFIMHFRLANEVRPERYDDPGVIPA